MPKYCSPKKTKNKSLSSISCFNKESLINIAKSYNKLYSKSIINIPTKFTNKGMVQFWKVLKKKISGKTNCSEENCWIETAIGENALLRDNTIKDFLRPLRPKSWNNDPNEWLSTTDIENVLKQYNVYNDFIFIGAVPIDFDSEMSPGMCVINELCNIDIEKLYKKGITKIGVVFNLDKHNEPGTHWISLFISIYKGSIFFFDSYGNNPNKEISTFIHRVRKMINNLFLKNPKILHKVDIDTEIVNKITKITKIKKINTHTYTIDKCFQKDTPVFYSNKKIYEPINIVNVDAYLDKYQITTNVDLPDNAQLIQKGVFVFYNSKRYQFKNSACGMYSIIFIIELLQNKSIYEVLKNMNHDDKTEALRDKYFRPNK
jgi:hypothetical protein